MSLRPLRILLVAETALPYVSGVTVATDALARGLGALGHEVLLLAPRPARGAAPADAGTSGPAPRTAWIPSVQLPPPAPRGYRVPLPLAGRRAMRAARDFAPDLVHVQSPFGAGHRGARLAHSLGVPLVFTHHTRFADYAHYLGPAARPSAAALRRSVAAFWERCDAVIAPGTDLGAEIAAALPPGTSTVVRVIPTGVDVRAIRAQAPVDLRAAAGWAPGVAVAVTLGRLAEEKSPAELLEMAALVPGLHLAVIGGGSLAAALRRRAGRVDLVGRTWFAGPQPRPAAIGMLRGADLFVVASRTETQGLVVAEALAAGLPVVAVDAPGVRDAVRHGTDGLLVAATPPATRPARLARAVAALLEDRGRLVRMGEAAARDAGRLALETRTREVLGLYRELLARRSA
ncbi:MAG: glycosyltransferase [Chloroflexota bacterium]